VISAIALYWVVVTTKSQIKYFREVPGGPITSWHFASWNLKNYDKFLDNLVRFARHAISIDENRKSFPRVGWGHIDDYQRNAHLSPAWLDQVWFSGNHSDIGGSYPESESRLSDVALRWMVDEFQEAIPEVHIQNALLVTSPNARGLQHDEVLSTVQMWPKFLPSWLRLKLTWSATTRSVHVDAKLHPTVLERLAEREVPHIDKSTAYRPTNLRNHSKAGGIYD
jgi:hypothetical protein